MSALPPLPSVGTGLPSAAWLDAGAGQYAHHYAAGLHTSVCGRYRNRHAVRAAWVGRVVLSKAQCPSCAKRLAVVGG